MFGKTTRILKVRYLGCKFCEWHRSDDTIKIQVAAERYHIDSTMYALLLPTIGFQLILNVLEDTAMAKHRCKLLPAVSLAEEKMFDTLPLENK